MDKYILSHILFVYIDICKQNARLLVLTCIISIARKHWITAIPWNWVELPVPRNRAPRPYYEYRVPWNL